MSVLSVMVDAVTLVLTIKEAISVSVKMDSYQKINNAKV